MNYSLSRSLESDLALAWRGSTEGEAARLGALDLSGLKDRGAASTTWVPAESPSSFAARLRWA